MNFAADLEEIALHNGWGSRTAYITEDGEWTYGELYQLAGRATNFLQRQGIGQGNRVLIALPDGIGWVLAFLGVTRAGCTAVPVNPDLTAEDHQFMADDCDAALVITTEELAGRFAAGQVVTVDRLLAEIERADYSPAVRTNVPLYVHYTSGTTGRPKGVVHPQRNPFAYFETVGKGCLRADAADVTLSVSKLYFTYGFCNAMVFPLYSGSATVLVKGRPSPATVGELVARHGVTKLYAVPSWFARMTAEGEPGYFKSVRTAFSGGERFTRAMTDRAADFLGAPVLNQLGATEIGCAATANTVVYNTPGTIGRVVPGYEIQLRDGAGNVLGDETEGDLWVRGASMMSGYLNRPDATAAVLVDGWLRTRDRVVRHHDGTFTHIARTDDLEMVGGITMSPMEVEDVLATHHAVREVAVAAVPDAIGATKLRAFVVAEPGRSAAELESELIALARSRLAAFKVPRSVEIVDALPRTSTGKLRRFVLRTPAAAVPSQAQRPLPEGVSDHAEVRS